VSGMVRRKAWGPTYRPRRTSISPISSRHPFLCGSAGEPASSSSPFNDCTTCSTTRQHVLTSHYLGIRIFAHP
jgi:hypothetical protein